MPMIRLTVPSGSLTEEGRKTVQRDLAAVFVSPDPDRALFPST
ncbi:hypothetical protein EDD92_1454 [Streptomyces sp. TLI_185]|nr:hypothetical protein EDD92_1454 [Streptomyces sp. TLI_185]